MKSNKLTRLTIAGLAILLFGCSTVGNTQIEDPNLVAQIQPGKSTKADVQRLMGPPTKQTYLDSGDTVWEYDLSQSQIKRTSFIPYFSMVAGGTNVEEHTLTVRFNNEGVVKEYGSGQRTGGSEY
jgi:outer membrane protein assembly factor BamE (lipoprotein component of BamABCDE complex)